MLMRGDAWAWFGPNQSGNANGNDVEDESFGIILQIGGFNNEEEAKAFADKLERFFKDATH